MAKRDRREFLDVTKWHELMAEYEKADDRSCAILCASYLDVCLEVVVGMALAYPVEVSELFFDGMQPLSSFSAKINMAYCLNLIDDDMKQDLHGIRNIRNDFAHKLHGLTFRSDPVRARTFALKMPDEWATDEEIAERVCSDPRQRFIFTFAITAGTIEGQSQEMAKVIHESIVNAKISEKRPR